MNYLEVRISNVGNIESYDRAKQIIESVNESLSVVKIVDPILKGNAIIGKIDTKETELGKKVIDEMEEVGGIEFEGRRVYVDYRVKNESVSF